MESNFRGESARASAAGPAMASYGWNPLRGFPPLPPVGAFSAFRCALPGTQTGPTASVHNLQLAGAADCEHKAHPTGLYPSVAARPATGPAAVAAAGADRPVRSCREP